MDKTELRRRIREKKRAMTPEEIEERSRELGRQFAATEAYRKAKTIYGYMPYNQEVRTVPMLEQAPGTEKSGRAQVLRRRNEVYLLGRPDQSGEGLRRDSGTHRGRAGRP